ncbi:MAG: ATP-binding protein [Deltaproteobacteria bacterium]|nr:ATP-binding protein [Deltaproteobacteria bacterium]
MDPALERLVLKNNPWLRDAHSWPAAVRVHLPETFVARKAEPSVAAALGRRDKVLLVTGPRQAGKSTLVWHLLETRGPHVLYLNCEEALVRNWCSTSPTLLLDDLRRFGKTIAVLFLDEVQHLPEVGLFLKGLADARSGLAVVATGSSAYEAREAVRESLAGRARRVGVFPFTLDEVAGEGHGAAPAVRDAVRRERFLRAVVFGGYPEAWLSDSPADVLSELLDALVLRDASVLFRIRHPDALHRIAALAARQVGSLVNLAEWAAVGGIDAKTVASYLYLLEQSHIVRTIRVFAGGKRRELAAAPKVFFVDNGLRNALSGGFDDYAARQDQGPLLENWVFSEIAKLLDRKTLLHYWRTKSGAEVDFVLVRNDRLVGIEAKASRMPRPRLERSARSFLDAYHPASFAVVNLALRHEEPVGATRVSWILPQDLPAFLAAQGLAARS